MPRKSRAAEPLTESLFKEHSTSIPETEIVVGGSMDEASADVLVIGLEEAKTLGAEAAATDRNLGGMLRALLDSGSFRGEALETTSLFVKVGDAPRRGREIGLGKRDALTAERLRRVAARAVRRASAWRASTVEIVLPAMAEIARAKIDAATLVQALFEGALLGSYGYLALKSERDKRKRIERIRVALPRGASKAKAESARLRARAIALGVYLARDLSCLPPNRLTPEALAEAAQRLARSPQIRVEVFDRDRIVKEKMGALLAVASGSILPPRFIVLEYRSGRPRARRIALIGKGLTFDSGGISLKPAQRMEEMKYDMCGAAAVLGVFRVVSEIGAPVDLIGAIPATENLPSGSAVRPGDVVDSYSGKTIEVLNTDAEGRLVLADALSYIEKEHSPDAMIDLATLTGAVGTALGTHTSGLFTEDDSLAARLEEAGRVTGERTWRLPLWDEFDEHIKSEIADVKNIANGNVGGGAIIGAAFLKQFVERTPWAHLDIANVAWVDKESHYGPKGPSGYGVRLLLRLIETWGKKAQTGTA
jgi:leucyl aminopeptidase